MGARTDLRSAARQIESRPMNSPDDPSLEPATGPFTRPAFALALYFVLTLAMTFPLVLNFKGSVPAGSVDLWQNYWNFWWWRKCIFDLHQSPYFTQYLFHPTGASMVFYTHSVLNMLASLPANLLFGYGAAYNFCVLMALTFSGWTMYLFVRELTGEARGAMLAGLVFAFFPQHMEQTLEHLNLFSTEFMPLAALFLIRLVRAGGRAPVIGLGLSFAANALVSWHLGILLTLALAVLAAAEFMKSERERLAIVRDLALSGALAALIVLPAVWPLIRAMLGEETYFQKPPSRRPVDAMFFFIPSDHHPLLGGFTGSIYAERRAYPSAGFLSYLGFIPLGLAAVAVMRRRPAALLWSGVLLASLLLAMGARPLWGGETIQGLPLPFALVSKIPLLRLMRVANRFLVVGSFALAVLAGLGFAALRRPTWPKFALFAALILLEYLWLPYPIQRLERSAYYRELAAADRAGAVLDLPFTDDAQTVRNMLAQTQHNRPIAGGYLSTTPPEARRRIDEDPQLSRLFGLTPRARGAIDTDHLRRLGFDTVILHRGRASRTGAEMPDDFYLRRTVRSRRGLNPRDLRFLRRALEAAVGPAVFEDDAIVAFDLGMGP